MRHVGVCDDAAEKQPTAYRCILESHLAKTNILVCHPAWDGQQINMLPLA